MIIKRYIVNNMNEAMAKIRYELGKDAVIISQRKIRKPGFMGLFSKKSLEVTAAVEVVKNNEEESMQQSIDAIKKVMTKNTEAPSQKPIERNEQVKPVSTELLKEIQEMKSMMNDMMEKAPVRAQRKTKLQTKLEGIDISPNVLKKIMTKVKNMEADMEESEKIRIAVEKMVTVSKTKMQGNVILVGPTGVGKTTTIAKLAGHLALMEKKKVGLITIDTYRIGAVEQLKTYAEIMNLPFKVVLTTKDMDSALESMKECDVVLIDTTGRSSKNAMQISELRAFVDKANTDNIHLVLSCTTKDKDIESIVAGYANLNYNNIIITKLDETSTYGSILNILDMAKKPLSFVTTGQNVPDDIKVMTVKEIANLILGEDSIC